MLLLRIMHISAYYTYNMTNIRSSMIEVDQSAHQHLILLLVYWITTFRTQLVVLFYWSGCHLAPYHLCFSKWIQHILTLREVATSFRPCNFNAKEISHLSQILDFELISQ